MASSPSPPKSPTPTESPFATRYCRRCSSPLPPIHQPWICLDCGLQFDPAREETFSTRPTTSRWKFWLPGFLVSVAAGTLSYALCLQTGEMGLALFFAVPVSFGAILGYATRIQTWALGMLGVVATCSVVMMLVSMHFAGFFCGFTLGLIFLFPMFLGIACGAVLRVILISTGWDQRWYFRWYIWLIAALPYLGQGIERAIPNREEIAVVRTELTVDATPQEAWNAIVFYEDVEHSPPWLLRLALPKPIRSEGDKQRAGEVVRCFYDRGTLAKRISKVEPAKKLSFDVVEQHLHFEHDVALKGGSFELTPVTPRKTRITLTTSYERKLAPRWIWEPIERNVIHTLHGHVLEGMRRKAEGIPAEKPEPSYEKKGPDGKDPLALAH